MENEGDDANSEESKLDAILREVAGGAPRSPPAKDDLLGAVLGHYRILARLGQGGMGVVYRAEDVRLRREVALKVLPSSVASDGERRRRFVREARSAAAANHPNIATVFEAGEADGRAFLAMELVEGETLRAKLRRERVGVGEAVRIARALGQGLAKAHEKNIVHRDLKPENVMLTTDGVVKILDFGLAKLRSMDAPATKSALEQQDTESHADERFMGTPGYMAPEQVTGREVDARCDVFALGVVLYEMVTGALPFEGETPAERVAAVLRDVATSPTSLNAEVGGALGRIIARCLRKRPEDRFASAQAVLEALGELGDGASSRRGVRSGGVRAMAWGFAALAVAAVAAVYIPRIGRTRAAAAKSASPPGPSAATTRATTMMDLPAPPTTIVDAAREYALGMGALHDDNGNAAIDHFERAVRLDPSMGAAHLRTAIAYYLTTASPERFRTEFARATELRSQLTARDRALMDALEPVLHRTKPDPAEAARRVEQLSRGLPRDVELWDWQLWLHGMEPATLTYAERAIALDPSDANALQLQGMALGVLGRFDEARVSWERCTAVSMTTSDCLASEAWTDMLAGHCAAFESDARRLVDRSPPYGHALLASALVSTGHPEAAVREECSLAVDALPEGDRKLAATAFDAQLALIAGDFTAARDLGAREAAALAAHPSSRSEYLPHYRLAMQLLTAALEEGDVAGAKELAQDFVVRSESWAGFTLLNSGIDLSILIMHLVPDFEPRRRERVAAWLGAGAYRGMVWPYAFAAPASTPDEARAALDAMPEYAPITSYVNSFWYFLGDVGIPDAAIGHVFLLAGKPTDALPYLQRAVAACADFDALLAHTRAALDLGTALEMTGDRAGACDAYAKVLARWGKAKPRSVTADAARARAAKLGCVLR